MILSFSKKEKPGGFSDEQLRVAARAVRNSMLASLDGKTEEQHVFSESFLSRMRILLHIDERRNRRKLVLQRAAIILIGFFLAGTMFLAFNPDARADLANWIRNTYENSVFYQFFSKNSDQSEDLYQTLPDIEFSWLPEEYEIQEIYRDEQQATLLLSNETSIIVFEYWISSSSDYYEFFTSDHNQEVVLVNGKQADYFQGIGEDISNVLVWSDKNVVFCLDSCMQKEDMIRIAEGIIKK